MICFSRHLSANLYILASPYFYKFYFQNIRFPTRGRPSISLNTRKSHIPPQPNFNEKEKSISNQKQFQIVYQNQERNENCRECRVLFIESNEVVDLYIFGCFESVFGVGILHSRSFLSISYLKLMKNQPPLLSQQKSVQHYQKNPLKHKKLQISQGYVWKYISRVFRLIKQGGLVVLEIQVKIFFVLEYLADDSAGYFENFVVVDEFLGVSGRWAGLGKRFIRRFKGTVMFVMFKVVQSRTVYCLYLDALNPLQITLPIPTTDQLSTHKYPTSNTLAKQTFLTIPSINSFRQLFLIDQKISLVNLFNSQLSLQTLHYEKRIVMQIFYREKIFMPVSTQPSYIKTRILLNPTAFNLRISMMITLLKKIVIEPTKSRQKPTSNNDAKQINGSETKYSNTSQNPIDPSSTQVIFTQQELQQLDGLNSNNINQVNIFYK